MIKLLSVKSLSVAVVALLCFGGIANGVTKNVKNTALPVAEKRVFLKEVSRCWNVGLLSGGAFHVKIHIRIYFKPDGRPDVGSIQMTGYEGGSQADAEQVYETVRHAIIRCGATGYKLPIEKYEQWKIVNITFNPENMRLK